MKQLSLRIDYTEHDSTDTLSTADFELLEKATLACASAYSPYSGFSVGAALMLANGKVIIGNNQENSAYPSGLCAERVALFSASANYPGIPIEAIALTATTGRFVISGPITPCGSCRQVMAEYENLHGRKIKIIMSSASGKVRIVEGTESLLPFLFHSNELKK
ncbi:MAG: cytidine deaminase [Bacteroidales bacterium]